MNNKLITIGEALLHLDIDSPEFNQKKEELVKAYEDEVSLQAYISRCYSSGAPSERIKEAGFRKWKSNNDAERNFKSLLESYAMRISGQESNIGCSYHGNIVVCGQSGTGKTFGALSVIKYLCNTQKLPYRYSRHNTELDMWEDAILDIPVYRNCFYSKTSKLVGIMQDRNNSLERHDLKINIQKSDFLVIDEVGRSLFPKQEREIIFDILDTRSDLSLPTMLISNMQEEEMQEHLGSAVMSRLLSDCVYFNTAGISDRRIS